MPASGPSPKPPPQFLYKLLLPSDDYKDSKKQVAKFFETDSEPNIPDEIVFPQTALDRKDSFIHLSTASQIPFVLNKFYSSDTPGTELVYIMTIDYDRLCAGEDVRWEPAGRAGELFAHVYGGELRGKYAVSGGRLRRNFGVEHREGEWDTCLEEVKKAGWLV